MSILKSIAVAGVTSLALAAPHAIAQTRPVQAKVAAPAESAACEKAVKDYLNALRFVKETSGNGIASRVEKAYINEAELLQITEQQGYCSAAQVLKSRHVSVR